MPTNSPYLEKLLHANPFDSELARLNSSYAAFESNKLVRVLDPDQRPTAVMELVHDSFRALMLSPKFPCIGAKAAIHRSDYRMGMYSKMNTPGFAWPTLVFNAHTQFEQLRERGKYKSIQATIRAREYALQGSYNALLSDFGEQSEARQYAGRPVGQDWHCPFHSRQ